MNSFEIVKTVRLTEKGTRQGEKLNQYTVVADRRANKLQIRQAVQELFKVKVVKVNTLNVRGKARRQRTAPGRQDHGLEKGHRHPERGRQDLADLNRFDFMPVKVFRPLTPSTRYITIASYDDITKTKPEKSLVFTRKKTGGRNCYGRVTSRGIGRGNKQKIRNVDFKRNKHGIEADGHRRLNMIPAARRVWRCCNTRTAKSVISSPRSVCRSARN